MEKIADDVWLLADITRLSLHPLNVYVMNDVLVDGATRWHYWLIRRQIKIRPISMIALTHCHPDHQGVCKRMCRERRIPLACHEDDVPTMEGRRPMLPDNFFVKYFGRLVTGEPWKVERVLREGDMIHGFRVVHSPGHTPGHVVYFRDGDRVAIAGDILSNMSFWTFRPGLYPPPPFFSADPKQHMQSILRLQELRPKLVLFGHGPPFTKVDQLDAYVTRMRRRGEV